MNEKTEQLIFYLIKRHPECSITSTMKLAYLIDLISVKKNKNKYLISNTEDIILVHLTRKFIYIESLIEKQAIVPKSDYAITGKEFIVYSLNESSKYNNDKINEKELKIIDGLLESFKGYGAKILTEIAYKTKPMIALGAKIGNSKGIGLRLDLAK